MKRDRQRECNGERDREKVMGREMERKESNGERDRDKVVGREIERK